MRHDNGPRIDPTPGRRKPSGTRTPSNTSSEVTEARRLPFRLISGAENPFESVGTMNPPIPSSVRAHTIATSAIDPLVIHIFRPSNTQSPPTRLARVRIPPGSEPASGSVNPKQPITSPEAIRGSQVCFCSSDPNFQIGNIANEPCTETNDLTPESPASNSRHANPYETFDTPAHPYPSRCIPNNPNPAISLANSLGNTPLSHQSATSGNTRSRTKPRTVSRTSRSSSDNSRSKPTKSLGSGRSNDNSAVTTTS
ncbi:MAG: hypothetical protein KatS3mg011_1529 [Acidimicrobiia bacterium]|nr:MAG: hypothetical protein KatS3mg011_1529 [Acidimicrobiia bacterium]